MRKSMLLAAFAALWVMCAPARAQFCPGVSPWVFDDVAASDPFCGYITWMAENGITLGCQTIDTNHRLYCPNANVTRAAMAAFMNRLGNVRVEAVDTGPGLTGGPITSTGTINLATTQLLPTTACALGQIPKWNGTAWACSNDASGTGTVTSVTAGAGLTGGTITTNGTLAVDTSAIQSRVSGTCAAGSSIRAIAADGTVTCQADNTGPANAYVQGGNAFGATAVIGTTDNNAIDIRVNGARAMRFAPGPFSPNIVGGHQNNVAAGANHGQTIAGGGTTGLCFDPNTQTANRPCINQTAADYAAIGGGQDNLATSAAGVIGGGYGNTVGGLGGATVGGGTLNTATDTHATIPGGTRNVASANNAFAAGYRANAAHAGSFAFSDLSDFNFGTAANNEFAVRATGGMRFVTAVDGAGAPTRTLKINGNGELDFGAHVGQLINLWGPANYGIGVQDSVQYARTDVGFAWFKGGVHASTAYDPGTGGAVLATLQQIATSTVVTGTFRAQVFTATSDRAAKTDFASADPTDVLEKVVSLPIATWSYNNERESGVRHIGPTAQDFKERFGVGYDDKTIATVDADGVALAAIQGLNAKLEAKVADQAHEIGALRSELAEMRRVMEVLMSRISPEGRIALQ